MKKIPWRGLLYLLITGYLFLDLKVCQGPIREAMRSRRDAAVEEARVRGWVALVNREPLTREQLDLAVARHLYQRGRKAEDISEKNLAMIRRAVLQGLIDDTLVRQYADGDSEKPSVSAEETAAFVEAWRSGSGARVGQSAEEELSRIWLRKRWLENRIRPGVEVTEEEARAWFEANHLETGGRPRPGFFEPGRVHLRHLLLAATDEAAAGKLGRDLLGGGKTLAELAAAHSRDEATRAKGGDLGWMALDELPSGIRDAVRELAPGETGGPFRSERGWHLVQVVAREPERLLTFDEVRPEIVAHLEAQRSEETFRVLMEKLRKVANLQVFPGNL